MRQPCRNSPANLLDPSGKAAEGSGGGKSGGEAVKADNSTTDAEKAANAWYEARLKELDDRIAQAKQFRSQVARAMRLRQRWKETDAPDYRDLAALLAVLNEYIDRNEARRAALFAAQMFEQAGPGGVVIPFGPGVKFGPGLFGGAIGFQPGGPFGRPHEPLNPGLYGGVTYVVPLSGGGYVVISGGVVVDVVRGGTDYSIGAGVTLPLGPK